MIILFYLAHYCACVFNYIGEINIENNNINSWVYK